MLTGCMYLGWTEGEYWLDAEHVRKQRKLALDGMSNIILHESDCNWTRTHNHLVHKQTLNHLVSLAKWLSVCLRTKWLWVWVQLQTLKLQISCLLQARSSLTCRQLCVNSLWNTYVTWQEHTASYCRVWININILICKKKMASKAIKNPPHSFSDELIMYHYLSRNLQFLMEAVN